MAQYRCTLVDSVGKQTVRTIEADNEQALTQKAKELGLFLMDSKEIQKASVAIKTIPNKDLIIYCRQMSVMIQSGITIIRAISILTEKTENKKTKQIYSNIYEMLQKGHSLADAMTAQNCFPSLLINMISAGEATGTLEKNFTKMAEHFEKENKLTNKVKGALMYPIILGIVTLGVVILLMVKVLPTFFELYAGHTLPLPTRILVAVSNFMTTYWYVLAGIAVGIIFGVPALKKIPSIHRRMDARKLKIPYIGKLNRTIYSARCARSFASLYASGIDVIPMLKMIGATCGNMVIEEGFQDVVQKVSKGSYISTAMEEMHVFDPMLMSMIYIGEESGSIDSILDRAADYFDEESDTATSRMVGIIEPVMIVVMALVVRFIAIAVMMPLYGMYSFVS
jgi:type IV pilus assembly protein PilC